MSPSHAAQQPQSATALWPVLLGLFFFGITFRSSSGAYLLGLIFVLSWLVFSKRPAIPALPRSLLLVSKIYLAVLCAHMLWTLLANEYSLADTLEGYRHYAELLLFIPFSAALYHCRAHWLALLWIPVLAVLVRVLHRTDYQALETTLFSKGVYGFGQHHVTFGMKAMLVMIAIAALAPVTIRSMKSIKTQWLSAVGITAVAALLTQALLSSGSRSAWGSLIAGLLVLAFCKRKEIATISAKRGALIAIAMLSISGLLIAQNIDKIETRLINDTQTKFNFSLSIEELPRDHDVFFARRVHLAYFGWQQWQQRPLLGHGPASVRPMLARDPDFHIHPHLHNTYIQVPMELGAIATISLIAVFMVLALTMWRIRPAAGGQYRAIYNLIVASFFSLALWSAAGFHLHSSDWRFVFVWYTAFAAFLIRSNHQQAKD